MENCYPLPIRKSLREQLLAVAGASGNHTPQNGCGTHALSLCYCLKGKSPPHPSQWSPYSSCTQQAVEIIGAARWENAVELTLPPDKVAAMVAVAAYFSGWVSLDASHRYLEMFVMEQFIL